MSDHDEIQSDDEFHPTLSNGGRTYFDMDEAFCARMLAAIEAGSKLVTAHKGLVIFRSPGRGNFRPGFLVSKEASREWVRQGPVAPHLVEIRTCLNSGIAARIAGGMLRHSLQEWPPTSATLASK